VEAEDDNFSQFNYVNELAQQIEKLDDSIKDMKAEIARYRGTSAVPLPTSTTATTTTTLSPVTGTSATASPSQLSSTLTTSSAPSAAGSGSSATTVLNDHARKKIVDQLENKLTKTEGKAKVYEEKYASANKTVGSLKQGIATLFEKLGCQSAASATLLGNAGVTESNMMQYLGLIEQRVNQLLQVYAQQRGLHLHASGATLGTAEKKHTSSSQLSILNTTSGTGGRLGTASSSTAGDDVGRTSIGDEEMASKQIDEDPADGDIPDLNALRAGVRADMEAKQSPAH